MSKQTEVEEYAEKNVMAAMREFQRHLMLPYDWITLYRDGSLSDEENWKNALAAVDAGWDWRKEQFRANSPTQEQ
ncbi:MAG TPA: hypothetical protein VGK24_05745 [Candidatus Angelobacter sp.]|jgi:hypothetical protein